MPLWSPEGKKFTAVDLGYLSLTFAMARQWRLESVKRQDEQQARAAQQRQGAAPSLRLVLGVKP